MPDKPEVKPEGKPEGKIAVKEAPGARFARSYEAYVNQLKDAAEVSRGSTAASRYQTAVTDLRTDIYKKWNDAWRRYTEAVRAASAEGLQPGPIEAYLTYLHDHAAIRNEFHQRSEALHNAYRDDLRAARKDYQDRCIAAYGKYLDDNKTAWQACDAKNLDAGVLVQISHLLSSAAQQAWSATSHS